MKRTIASATAIALLLGATAASAANIGTTNERPDLLPVNAAPLAQQDITAGSIFSTKELARRGLSAGDTVSVTELPSGGISTRLGRG
jgi:hypothetical protein